MSYARRTVRLACLALIAAPLVLLPRGALAGGPIDINTAGIAELTGLNGIGQKKAEAIVAYREAHGPFRSVDDLTQVKGIGRRTVDKNRDRLSAGRTPPADARPTPAGPGGVTPARARAPDATGAHELPAADAPTSAAPATSTATGAQAGNRIDLNTAGVSELIRLKGIGTKTAEKIIAYREQHGPFRTVDDLLQVKGIGKKSLEKIRDRLTVGR